MGNSNNFEIEPLNRTQILVVMGVTAVLLLVISKIWQKIGSVQLLPVVFDNNALVWGISLAAGITITSSITVSYTHLTLPTILLV